MAQDSGPGWLLNKKTPLWNKLALVAKKSPWWSKICLTPLWNSRLLWLLVKTLWWSITRLTPLWRNTEYLNFVTGKIFGAETQHLATFVELTKSPKLVNQESLVDRSVGEYPLHFVGTTLEKKSKMSAGNTSRSLPNQL